jgi:HEAT repeat protein
MPPRLVAALVESLDESSWSVRLSAANALRETGLAAAQPFVVAALIHSWVEDDDLAVRDAAAEAVASLGRSVSAADVSTALERRLLDDNFFVRQQMSALGAVGPMPVMPALVAAVLEQPTHDSQRLQQSLASLLGSLVGDDPDACRSALEAFPLVARKVDSRLADVVCERLGHPDWGVRVAAARAVRAIPAFAQAAAADKGRLVRALATGLDDSDTAVRAAVAAALVSLGRVSAVPDVIERLISGLESEAMTVRAAAAEALAAHARVGIRLFRAGRSAAGAPRLVVRDATELARRCRGGA